ncbi:hypothetical protein FMK18_10115 [Klebsiella grimontii]|nr:hypothetical protein [Klebsiella grimontii]
MIGLSLRGEHQHAQRQRDFCFCNAHSFPLNPCFVLCLSRSHKSPVGGKEEKVLIYNEKELNKTVDIVFPHGATKLGKVARTGAQHRLREDPLPLNMHPTELQIRN